MRPGLAPDAVAAAAASEPGVEPREEGAASAAVASAALTLGMRPGMTIASASLVLCCCAPLLTCRPLPSGSSQSSSPCASPTMRPSLSGPLLMPPCLPLVSRPGDEDSRTWGCLG